MIGDGEQDVEILLVVNHFYVFADNGRRDSHGAI